MLRLMRSVVVTVGLALTLACASGEPPSGRPAWALAIHGGAGAIPADAPEAEKRAYLASLRRVLELGRSVLAEGGTSLDAVERVIAALEDDPLFNAGKGAVLNREGEAELDASIMDGATLACGAVAAVRTVKNPIQLARRVMEKTPHVLLAREGAERFAEAQGLSLVPPAYFVTERRQRQWEQWRASQGGGTVGAVALDRYGNLAAGTSTGGLTGKMPGRVGDSPIIGAGTYAANATCAVSGTGRGEEFIRHGVARRIALLMELRGLDVEEAARQVVHEVLRPGDGGVIAVDRHGHIAMEFNTPGMFRGAADATGRFEVAIWKE